MSWTPHILPFFNHPCYDNVVVNNPRERILIVESDPAISHHLTSQALEPAGYVVNVVKDAGKAIITLKDKATDAVIADLDLPGLSGKDFLVATNAQGFEIPVIVLTQSHAEVDVLQAFRLGAADYISWPARDTEVINVIERVLKLVRVRKERARLAEQLQGSNQELQKRVNELTNLLTLGQAFTSITSLPLLLDEIIQRSVKLTLCDLGWLVMRREPKDQFSLEACVNLPPSLVKGLHQIWEDQVGAMVAMSGEALSIHGEALHQFKIAALGQAALIVPIKMNKNVLGLITVMRTRATPFSSGDHALVEAIADYASIALVNAHIFGTMNDRIQSDQNNASTKTQQSSGQTNSAKPSRISANRSKASTR